MMKNWVTLIYAIARNFGGTCSSVEMLKGYMVRERLGTPGLIRYLQFRFRCL